MGSWCSLAATAMVITAVTAVGAAGGSMTVSAAASPSTVGPCGTTMPPIASTPARVSKPVLGAYEMTPQPGAGYPPDDLTVIQRQIKQAYNNGMTGFRAEWDGSSTTKKGFEDLLRCSAKFQQSTGHLFASAIMLDVDSARTTGFGKVMKFLLSNYMGTKYYLHEHGKPVMFLWDPHSSISSDIKALRASGAGRTLLFADGINDCSTASARENLAAGASGIYVAFDCTGQAQPNLAAVVRSSGKSWIAGAYADSTYETQWKTAIGTKPLGITIATYNNYRSVHIEGKHALLAITKCQSHEYRTGRHTC